MIRNEKMPADRRLELIRLLGEVPQTGGASVLLEVLAQSRTLPIRLGTLTALQRYPDAAIADSVLKLYVDNWQHEPDLQAAAQTMLSSRPAWAVSLLHAVNEGRIALRTISLDIVRSISASPIRKSRNS